MLNIILSSSAIIILCPLLDFSLEEIIEEQQSHYSTMIMDVSFIDSFNICCLLCQLVLAGNNGILCIYLRFISDYGLVMVPIANR